MRSLVVAHYNESIEWIKKITPETHVFLYNKGEDQEFPDHWTVVNLPNIGREAHTFMHHIVECYDYLHEQGQITFVQGNPNPHYPYFVPYYNRMRNAKFAQFGSVWGCRLKASKWFSYYYETLFEEPFSVPIHWAVGGQVLTTADNIKTKPLTFWKWALKFAEESPILFDDVLRFGCFHECMVPFFYSGMTTKRILKEQAKMNARKYRPGRTERTPFLYL